MENDRFFEIGREIAIEFLMPRHYAGRKPQISKAFGWYIENELVAVCTFGKPASPSLCTGICGKENAKHVYELNRLCRVDELEKPLSMFVAWCLRELKKYDWIIVSYSDTGMNHHGYIYQACNFLYTGATKQRTDKYTPNGKHSRHYSNAEQTGYRVVRTAKHRYVYFCTYSKQKKREWRRALNYPVMLYPKGDNKNYILGEYQKRTIVRDRRCRIEQNATPDETGEEKRIVAVANSTDAGDREEQCEINAGRGNMAGVSVDAMY